MFKVVPSIDLRGGRVVRLRQGDYARQIDYPALDPIATARSFRDAGAEWMHVVDLDGAKTGSVQQAKLIAQVISASELKVQVGGGVRGSDDVRRLLDAGARRVVIGTKAIEDWPWFESIAANDGTPLAGKIVLALDAKDGVVATRGWTTSSGQTAVGIASRVSDWPLAGILYTDVSKDGMLQGPNLEQTRRLAEAGKVPVIASGGVGQLQHVLQLIQLPIWGVIVGRSLHEGALNLREAIAAASAPRSSGKAAPVR